jgi:multidrug efflux pump subunit AcrB
MTPGFAVERRVSTWAAVLLVAILGGFGLRRWESGLLPYRRAPGLAVVARGPNRSQADLLAGVTAPLERRFRALPGVAAVVSETTDGRCRFELQTVRGSDLARLRLAVHDVLDSSADLGIEDVSVAVTAGEARPGIELAVVGEGGRGSGAEGERAAFVSQFLRAELAAVPGVERVEVVGLALPHAVVTPLAAALAARGASAADLVARLGVVGRSVQAGRAREGGILRPLVIRETVSSLEQLGALRFKTANGDAALGDVARIGVRAIGNGTWFRADGADGTLLRIFRTPGVDDAALSRQVRQRIEQVAARLPPGLRLRWIADRGDRGDGSRRSLVALAAAMLGGLLLGLAPLRWLAGTWARAAMLASLLPVVLLLAGAGVLLLAGAGVLLAGGVPDLLALAALAATAGLLWGDPLAAWATTATTAAAAAARDRGDGDPAWRGAGRPAPAIAAGVLAAAAVLAAAVWGGDLQPWLAPAAATLVAALTAAAVVAVAVVPALATFLGSTRRAERRERQVGPPRALEGGEGGPGLGGVVGLAPGRAGSAPIGADRIGAGAADKPGQGGADGLALGGASAGSERGRPTNGRGGGVYRRFLERGMERPGRVLAAGAAGICLLMAAAWLTARGIVRIRPASTVEVEYRVARNLAPEAAAARGRALDAAVRRAVAGLGAAVISRSTGAEEEYGPDDLGGLDGLENAANPASQQDSASPENLAGLGGTDARMGGAMSGRIELRFADAAGARRARRQLHDTLRAGPDVSLAVLAPAPAPAPAALADLDEPLQVYAAPSSPAGGAGLRRKLAAACMPSTGSGEAAGTAASLREASPREELRLFWRGNAVAGAAGDLADLDEQVHDSLGDVEAGTVEIPGLAPAVHVDPVAPRDLAIVPLRLSSGIGAAAPGSLGALDAPGSSGALDAASADPSTLPSAYVPLGALASLATGPAPRPLWRLDGRPALALRCPAGAAAAVARALAREPSSGHVASAVPRLEIGLAPRLALALAGAFAVILLGLMVLYDSVAVAGAVVGAAAAPLAVALAAVAGMPRTLWVPALLGLLVAAALAIRPGLRVVARAEVLRRSGGGEARAAVIQAAEGLVRPLLATAVLGWLALLPLLAVSGDVGELSRPLALAIGWGGAGGLLAGLLLAPALYLALLPGPLKERLEGDPAQPPPPAGRAGGRNAQWTHFHADDVLP